MHKPLQIKSQLTYVTLFAFLLLSALMYVVQLFSGLGPILFPNLSSPTILEAKIFAARLRPEDVPGNYRSDRNAESLDQMGATGRTILFYGDKFAPTAHIVEDILIFESQDLAADYYRDRVENTPAMKEYQISNTSRHFMADEIFVSCGQPSSISVPGQGTAISNFCKMTALYDTAVVEVRAGVFEKELLSMSEYIDILFIADQKATAAFSQSE